VRRGARWALEMGAALIALATLGHANADVLSIPLQECSTGCIASGIDDRHVWAYDDAVSLSRSGGSGADAPSDLIFDPKALAPVLAEGLPSPIASIAAETPESPGVSPYAFFEDVVDIPLPVDPRTGLAAASISLFAPSLIGRVTLTDVLSDSNELFKTPLRPAM